jgi:hypothetical protein
MNDTTNGTLMAIEKYSGICSAADRSVAWQRSTGQIIELLDLYPPRKDGEEGC